MRVLVLTEEEAHLVALLTEVAIQIQSENPNFLTTAQKASIDRMRKHIGKWLYSVKEQR